MNSYACTGCGTWTENVETYLDEVRQGHAKWCCPDMRYLPFHPIDMVLFCPKCGLQHIDAPDASILAGDAAMYGGDWPGRWTNPPHRSHQCQNKVCGHVWRPADVPTNGVAAVQTKGKADSPVAAHGYCNAAHGLLRQIEELKGTLPRTTCPSTHLER